MHANGTYFQCLTQYLTRYGYPFQLPTPFHYPLDYFHLLSRRGKPPVLCFSQPFPLGSRTTDKITSRTIKGFLSSCGLPGSAQDAEVQYLFENLVALLKTYRTDPSYVALLPIQRHDPQLACRLRYAQYFLVNGCLFLQFSQDTVPQFCNSFLREFSRRSLPQTALRRYFNTVTKHRINIPPYSFSPPQMILQNILQLYSISFFDGRFRVSFPSFRVPSVPVPSSLPLYYFVKPIYFSSYQSECQVPPQAAQILFSLTGGDVATTEKLSQLFAQILSLNPPGATVIYSHSNAESLRVLLSALFSPWVVPFDKNGITINKLVTKKNLHFLLCCQIEGYRLILLRDIPASQNSRSKISRLLQGKPLPVNDPYVSQQKLQNLSHLLCITSDRRRALTLQKQLNAHWIDLTPVERQFSLPPSITPSTIEWFQCFFPLRGLQILSTGEILPPKVSPEPFDAVEDFLNTRTLQSRGCFCTTRQLYDAYCDYYCAHFQGPPPLTGIRFGKKARTYVAAHKPGLGYHKARLGRDKRPLWYYTGLQPLGPEETTSIPVPDTISPSYQGYLNSISALIPPLVVKYSI